MFLQVKSFCRVRSSTIIYSYDTAKIPLTLFCVLCNICISTKISTKWQPIYILQCSISVGQPQSKLILVISPLGESYTTGEKLYPR
jgi:hypothetical protein